MKVNEMENRKNKVKQESEKNEMNFLELDEMEE